MEEPVKEAIGSKDWLLGLVKTIAAEVPPPAPAEALSRARRRAEVEARLYACGLAYGTAVGGAGAAPREGPGARAFAQLVAAIVRACAYAGNLCGAPLFCEAAEVNHEVAAAGRANQLLALLAAQSDDAEAAQPLFADPLGPHGGLAGRLAGRVATRLARRYLEQGGPFAALPLHNGLCAIEARAAVTLALGSFRFGRISRAAVRLNQADALRWRAILAELLSLLSRKQERGDEVRRAMEQVIRTQHLPAREARLLRRALADPRPLEVLVPSLRSEAQRRYALEQVLLGALVDNNFEPGEVAFVDQLAAALEVDHEKLANVEIRVGDFYRENREALAALRLAETPEGFPHALTSRVQEAVADNLDRLLQEIRETGELAELLAKAAAGGALSAEEKSKVREQLVDLAKTIPALAIFAAPGGGLLLPILIKLLPFNLLPSSFVDPPRRALPPAKSG